jgi:Secretion system C-terminal sorting domain
MKKNLFILLVALSTLANATTTTTFNDVAPIFYANCTSCHSPGGIGPFPMTSFSEIKAKASSISHEVSDGTMPPWLPDTTYVKFLHSQALTETDKNAIIKWVSDGAVEGDPSLAPTAPVFAGVPHPRKLAGVADLVVGIGGFESNSKPGMTNPYNCFSIPMGLTEGKWLRAMEIRPGNYNAVHHVVVTVDTTGTTTHQLDGNCNQQPGEIGLGGWSSGAAPVVYPNQAPFKAGQFIPKNSNLVIQIHYAPGSQGELDSTMIRFFFYDNADTVGIRKMQSEVLLQKWIQGINIQGIVPATIPANTKMTMVAEQNELRAPAAPTTNYSIYSVDPHSHFVCTSIKNYAYRTVANPTAADTIKLINIKKWDYHWQGFYYLPKMIKIPTDFKLKSEHVFDNTANNTALITDPNRAVTMGTATENEMLFDAFLYTEYRTGDENIDIAALIENDPIFATGQEVQHYEPVVRATGLPPLSIEEKNTVKNNVKIYPNPASDNLNLVLLQPSNYTGRLVDLTGQTVLTANFNNSTTIDVSSIPAGIYFISITNTTTNETTTTKIAVVH